MTAARRIEVVLRPARMSDAASIASVQVASWRATYRGIIPEEHLRRMSVVSRTTVWRNVLRTSAITLVAESDGLAVGVASGVRRQRKVPGFSGEVEVLYLRPDWKRRGIGQALLVSFARVLSEAGVDSMIIWVLARNESARKFYKALGGVEVTREWEFMGTTPLEKVAYGWSRLDDLIDSSASA